MIKIGKEESVSRFGVVFLDAHCELLQTLVTTEAELLFALVGVSLEDGDR